MLDAQEIDLAIAELEYKESSYANYAKLADLYVIRDKMTGGEAAPVAARALAVEASNDSEFLRAIAGKDPTAVWGIIDELMDTLKVVNVRAYNSVMRKISNI